MTDRIQPPEAELTAAPRGDGGAQEPQPPSLDYARKPSGRWSVGTLSYTTAGIVILFCWLLWGDFAWQMKERSVGAVVQLMFKKFEAGDLLIGLLLSTVPGLLSVLIGPIVSHSSDRHRGRWGRRIPYLLIPTPIISLTMIGFAFSPVMGHWLDGALGGRSPGYNNCVLLLFGCFWMLFEVGTIAANSIFGALINDVVPQELVGRFYGLFRAVSLGCGIIFNWWLLGMAEVYYVSIFVVIALIYAVGFTLMCLRVKEGDYPPPSRQSTDGAELRQAEPSNTSHPVRSSRVLSVIRWYLGILRSYFVECFSQPYYLLLFSASMMVWAAFIPANSFGIFFAKSVNFNLDTYGKLLAGSYVCSFVLSVPLGWLADRFHPMRVGLVAMVLYAAAMIWGGLFANDGRTFAVALVAHTILSGVWMTGTASMGQRLFPRSRFAQFGAAAGLLTTLGTLGIAPAVGAMLDWNNHAYRYAYLASGLLMLVAILLWIMLWFRFRHYGGPSAYVAPEAFAAGAAR